MTPQSRGDYEPDDFYVLTRTNVGTESKPSKNRNDSKSKSIDFDYVISSSSRNDGYQAEEDSITKEGRKFLNRNDSSDGKE